ncbi:MAG: recombination protein NinG [Patescibacteria group bacterium]
MSAPKKKKCRICGASFLPFRSTDKTCSIPCAKKLAQYDREKAKEKKAKAEERKKATRHKRMYFSGQRLTKVADTMFSLYIRKRDEGKPCVTCPDTGGGHQCGHFVTRGEYATRWTHINAHGQCPSCNAKHIGNGEVWKHGQAIDRMYGQGTSDQLMAMR